MAVLSTSSAEPAAYSADNSTFELKNGHISAISATSISNKLTISAVENAGSGKLTVNNAGNTLTDIYATGGDLTVRGGMLAFGESGVLSSVTNITVSGEGSLVTLVSKANLPNHKKSILRLNDGGKLQIPSGMNLKVAELYIDGDRRPDGNYTAGNAADIVAGEGSLIVGSPAFKIIIR